MKKNKLTSTIHIRLSDEINKFLIRESSKLGINNLSGTIRYIIMDYVAKGERKKG